MIKRKTMKNNIFKASLSTLVLGIVTGFAFSGCSNSEDLADGVTPQDGMERVSFKISEKDFEPAEEVAGTRAAAQPLTELQDLGDGWQAEVSLVPDTTHKEEAKAKTRTIYTPTHYTIQAYQGGALKGQTKGTFNGSSFTPDAGELESISLPHGTYDFVCFNDKVTANGTLFTVNRTDAGTARFTIKRSVLINQDPKQYVAFEMKHAGALVNTEIHFVNCNIKAKVFYGGPWPIGAMPENTAERLKFTVETLPNKIPEKMIYDFSTDSYNYPTMGQVSQAYSMDDWMSGRNIYSVASGATVGRIFANEKSNFNFLPSTDCANLKLSFTFGELYGRSLVGKSITVPTHKLVQSNKKYRVIVKLFMGYMYLFKDGTVGALSSNSGKVPVGVVVDPYDRVAVALSDAVSTYSGGSSFPQWSSSSPSSQETSFPSTSYTDLFHRTALDGNPGTYSSSSPAQKMASDYYQTVGYGNPTSGIIGKNEWYVPTLDDFLAMGVALGKMPNRGEGTYSSSYDFSYLVPSNAPATGFSGAYVSFPAMDITRFNKAFTDAGGTAPSGRYWTLTECKDGSDYKQATITVMSYYDFSLLSKNLQASVRPFIRY